jgi:hypothetical protein
MEQRLRMDVPTLNDPPVRDLFQESELFVRSFGGAANFGIFSPLDFLRILTLISEAASHILVLWSLTSNRTHLSLLAFSIISYILPLLISWRRSTEYADDHQDVKAARAVAKQNKMHSMARNDAYRPEVILFGLGPWILDNWAQARKTTLGLDQQRSFLDGKPLKALMSNINTTGLLVALHNVRFDHFIVTELSDKSADRFQSSLRCSLPRRLWDRSLCTVAPLNPLSSLLGSWCNSCVWHSRACSSWAHSLLLCKSNPSFSPIKTLQSPIRVAQRA